MLYPGPTGGFAELFPSPVKGHDPGLSDEQNAETQALVSAQVTQLQSQTRRRRQLRWPERSRLLAMEA